MFGSFRFRILNCCRNFFQRIVLQRSVCEPMFGCSLELVFFSTSVYITELKKQKIKKGRYRQCVHQW